MGIEGFDDQCLLEEIGNIQTHVSATFLKENYQQLSFSEAALRQKKVGILGTLFPPSWRDPAQRGNRVLLVGTGAGLTFGALALTF